MNIARTPGSSAPMSRFRVPKMQNVCFFFFLGALCLLGPENPRAYSDTSGEKDTAQAPSLLIDAAGSEKGGDAASAYARAIKERVLAVGERLRVKIYPEDEFIKGTETDVSSEGDVTLPLIGKVRVEGLKVVEAERKIVDILAQDYLVNPVVVIEVVEKPVAEKPKVKVSILGQVQKPGTYEFPADQKLTLLQSISTAGGFTDIANAKNIKIIRKKEGEKAESLRANAESIIAGQKPDVELEAGDVVHVGESFF